MGELLDSPQYERVAEIVKGISLPDMGEGVTACHKRTEVFFDPWDRQGDVGLLRQNEHAPPASDAKCHKHIAPPWPAAC